MNQPTAKKRLPINFLLITIGLSLIIFAVFYIITLKTDQINSASAETHSTVFVKDSFIETNIIKGETNSGNYTIKYPQTTSADFNQQVEEYVTDLKTDFFQSHTSSSTLIIDYSFTHYKNLYSFVLSQKVKQDTLFTEKIKRTFLLDSKNNSILSPETVVSSKQLIPLISKRFSEQEKIKQFNAQRDKKLELANDESLYKQFTISNKNITFYFNPESFTIPYNDTASISISLNSIRNSLNEAYKPAPIKKKKASKTPTKVVSLTFDDGPNTTSTKQILAILKKEQIKATFFIVGTQAKANPKMVKEIYKAGHELGNHSFTHADLARLSDKKIKNEITKTNKYIKEASGHNPTVFRPPYGSFDQRVINYAKVPMILWSVDTLDWQNHNTTSILHNIEEEKSKQMTLLMHDIHDSSADALPKVIKKLKKENYTFVTASELLEMKNKK